MASLSARQQDVLRAIAAFQKANGFSPTVRELCDLLRIGSTNAVQDHLNALRKKGAIHWQPTKARTLALTDEGRRALP